MLSAGLVPWQCMAMKIIQECLLCVCVLSRGVVIVDVPLFWLDINQCPQDYFVPNAFKDTARCHYDTTYVCIIYVCCSFSFRLHCCCLQPTFDPLLLFCWFLYVSEMKHHLLSVQYLYCVCWDLLPLLLILKKCLLANFCNHFR